MDRFDAMRAFVQVVDSGSYTRAARQLNLHKATVSQQIQQLENRLGVRLLVRTTRSVSPTREGLAYYQQASVILQQVDTAESMLHRGGHGASGHLRVNVPVAMGRSIFASEMRDFLARHPKVTIELGCSDRTVDLVRGGIDCALRGGTLPDSGLSARPVGRLRFVLCAAPSYTNAHDQPGTPQALASHQQVGYLAASTGRMRPIQLERDGQSLTIGVPARFTTTDSTAALSAALDGLGLIVLAQFVADPHLASGALVRVLPGWQTPALPLHWVTPTAKRRTARVQVFMDWADALLRRRLGTQLETH